MVKEKQKKQILLKKSGTFFFILHHHFHVGYTSRAVERKERRGFLPGFLSAEERRWSFICFYGALRYGMVGYVQN